MAKFTAVPLQTVPENQNVQFTDSIKCNRGYVLHTPGSGRVTLRGIANQCQYFSRYKVTFGANIAIPAGGTVGEISIALAVEGEPISSATAIVTPAAVEEFANVFVEDIIDVPRGCCLSVSVRNTSDQPINVQNSNLNANLIVERIA